MMEAPDHDYTAKKHCMIKLLVNTENEWSYLNECCINKQIANRDTINV